MNIDKLTKEEKIVIMKLVNRESDFWEKVEALYEHFGLEYEWKPKMYWGDVKKK